MGPRIAVTLCGHATRRCEVAREQYLDAIRRAGAEPIPVDPTDATPEEFDSTALKVEKVIPGKSKGLVRIGPLTPGRYEFIGEFNAETAKGVVIAE